MDWVRILAYITGTVDQELLLRNEYLATESRILKAQLKTPLRLTDAERMTLAEIAQRRLFVEVDSVWRGISSPGTQRICCTLSCRTKSSR